MPQTWAEPHLVQLVHDIADSYQRLIGRPLIAGVPGPSMAQAEAMFDAPFALLAHDGGQDPRFVYANRTAQHLWELDWDAFVGMPSRYSAEPDARDVRAQMLAQVSRVGYLAGYSGVRISATGRRFRIDDAAIWNVADDSGLVVGQAARIDVWTFLT